MDPMAATRWALCCTPLSGIPRGFNEAFKTDGIDKHCGDSVPICLLLLDFTYAGGPEHVRSVCTCRVTEQLVCVVDKATLECLL